MFFGGRQSVVLIVLLAIFNEFISIERLINPENQTNIGLLRTQNALKEDNEDALIRFKLWQAGLDGAKSTLYTGMGIGQFRFEFTKLIEDYNRFLYLKYEGRSGGLTLHNYFLTLFVEFGLIPFLLVVAFFLRLFRANLKRMKNRNNKALKVYLVPVLLLLVSVIYGNSTAGIVSPLIWLVIAMASVPIMEDKKEVNI